MNTRHVTMDEATRKKTSEIAERVILEAHTLGKPSCPTPFIGRRVTCWAKSVANRVHAWNASL